MVPPLCCAVCAIFAIFTCSHTTGSQHAPHRAYSASVITIHFVSHAQPAFQIIQLPEASWNITVGVVNHQSAFTTQRLTTDCASSEPLRFAQKR